MSLRGRLLVGVLGLVTGALVIAALAIYADERSFLYARLDQRVVAAAAPIAYALGVDQRDLDLSRPVRRGKVHPRARLSVITSPTEGISAFLPSGTYGALVDHYGNVLRGPVVASFGGPRVPVPAFPAHVSVTSPGSSPRFFTVSSAADPGIRYRVVALELQSGAGTLLVAITQRDVEEALDRLVLVEVVVVASVVLVLVLLGWVMIRIALRPLAQMGAVASAIAAGDLSQRVAPTTHRTEVGRLGLSLNRMLEQIEQAFAERARSEERRRQFLADASHELRTPLASIRGYAELFRLGAAEDPQALARAMERIESEAARMGALVEDLLVLARMDELPEARRFIVNVGELAVRAAGDARAMAPERTIGLHADDRAAVIGDPDALEQVLSNLVSNAVVHTPHGTPVSIRVARQGPEVLIEVADRGPGIPGGAQERVFDRFWRADHSRPGSGLGLAIVKEIVAAHHGAVRAENHPQGGARFTVRLPAASVPAAGPAPVNSSQPDARDESTSPRGTAAAR